MDASGKLEIPADTVGAEARQDEAPKAGFDLDSIMRIAKSPAFLPGLTIIAAITFLFWSLFRGLPALWFGEDGYYSHGILVPLISAYVIYRWWPTLKNVPVKPAYFAVIPLLLVLAVVRPAVAFQVDPVSSVLLIVSLLFSIAFVAGWRWMLSLAMPTMYLAFALPIWNMAITYYTNPLQTRSTDVAYWMLNAIGYQPARMDNFIYLNHFILDVGVPCSGLKLVLALYAFTIFFALIARLRWWANLILVALVPLPLALFINGLRISLIGIVGENYGSQAGHTFHDYSGYITLIVCFFILFRICRWLGWKD